jgi:hypothetical protein
MKKAKWILTAVLLISNYALAQNVVPQVAVNNLSGVRYVTYSPATYNWSAFAGTLTGGTQATITLGTCPLGISGTDTTTYVQVSGSPGATEYVQIQGGTCVPGGSGQTIKITPANSHTSGLLGSASSGIQEAINDAMGVGTSTYKANWRLAFQPTNPPGSTYYTINATVTIPNGVADIDGSGASIDCEALDKCFYIPVNANEIVMHGFRVSTKTSASGAAITNTACGVPLNNITTITSTLNPPVGSWVDIQNTDTPHYWGVHGPIVSSSTSSYTLTDNNCAWASSTGSNTIPSAATPGVTLWNTPSLKTTETD